MKFKTQSEMFNYIWETRPHFSELTGKPLLEPNYTKWHWQFLHVLPKGSYPKWKFESDNILLALPEEHSKQESFPKFIEKRDELKRRYYKEFYNKTF
jgi:hypothetical protein